MYIDREKISKQEIKRISIIFTMILVFTFLTLLFILWNIQIVQNDYYLSLAINNIFKTVDVKPPRGLIVDKNDKILAENKINFTLYLITENLSDLDKSLEFASNILEESISDLKKKVQRFKNLPKFYPIPIKKNVPLKKVIYIESRSEEYPEFEIDIEPTRAYPYRETAAHILGYLSEITAPELKDRKDLGYRLGDSIGKSGIEKTYEEILQGTKGIKYVLKDNLGRIQEIVNEKKPVIGDTVKLTIDIELQKFIGALMKEHKGTIAVVDLKTGGLLAIVNKPSYNPELFSGSFNEKEWQSLIEDPGKPLHNKFLQGFYSPGSVFKIVMALAGLQEKAINTQTQVLCTGREKIYDRYFHCWKRDGHGFMNITDAIKNSCNIFFYQLGKKLDIDVIAKYAKYLGLGHITKIDLPNEAEGLIPTKALKLQRTEQPWYPGETISIAIGQGMINVTPAQILLMISTVALKGQMPQLHLIDKVIKKNKVISQHHPTFKQVPIEKKYFDIVIEGLYKVVNDDGTARAAKVEGLDICGKTGTCQIIAKDNPNYKKLVKQKRFTPHSWFASFGPKNDPLISIVVFIEHGGDGGIIAAPMAAKIYRHLLKK